MNPIKTPHQLLLEEAGFAPQSPGMVNTGQQMLNQTGVVPHFAPGGKVIKGVLSALEREANKAKFLEGSKIREPLYHGTFKDFNAFDKNKRELGFHLGNPNQASYIIEDAAKNPFFGSTGANVMPVHASIKKPYEAQTDLGNWSSIQNWKDYLKQWELEDSGILNLSKKDIDNLRTEDDIRNLFTKKGYDSIEYPNHMESVLPDAHLTGDYGKSYMVFEPTQIKSATGNRGTFDPTDPDITKAAGGSINKQDMSPQDMLAALLVQGHEPQHFAKGGSSIMELYNQIPKKQEEYKKQQSDIAQGAANYYNQQTDPYFQNIINKASSHNFDQMMQEQNPEPTFQAQPVTPTSWTRDQFAKVIGETPADRLFGTGSEGQKLEYMPLQFINPISQVTDAIGAVPEVAHQLHEGNVGSAGAIAGLTALGAAPFAGPIKKIIKKIRHK